MNTINFSSRNLIIVLFCIVMLAATAASQERPRGSIFGGYQYTRIGGAAGVSTNGWTAAVTGNVNRWLGVTGDIGGSYKSFGGANGNAYTFMFGPTFSRNDKTKGATPFAHFLVGGFRASAGFGGMSASTSGFAVMAGGGVDVNVTRSTAIRVIQGDWLVWRTQGLTEKANGRISSGLVFRF